MDLIYGDQKLRDHQFVKKGTEEIFEFSFFSLGHIYLFLYCQ